VIDLTPFGFTPTESLAYSALLDLGPSTAYAIAKSVGIARANGYQALDGLVTKGAAQQLDQTPRRYRAVQPTALLASVTERAGRQLDRLEHQISSHDPGTGSGAPVMPVEGLRALREVTTRTVVRSAGPVVCLAPADFLATIAPGLRARDAAGAQTRLWSLGAAPDGGPVVTGSIDPHTLPDDLAVDPTLILVSATAAGICARAAEPAVGYWTNAAILITAIRAALRGLGAS